MIESRTNKIVGFKTKIVEGVGTKLKQLLPNTNPWRGSNCGRDCIPCSQPGDLKQDCRKRNVIYENKCTTCNPDKEKGQKDGKDLSAGRKFPAEVYMNALKNTGQILLQNPVIHTCTNTGKITIREKKQHSG